MLRRLLFITLSCAAVASAARQHIAVLRAASHNASERVLRLAAASNITIDRTLPFINAVAVTADDDALAYLASHPDVESLTEDTTIHAAWHRSGTDHYASQLPRGRRAQSTVNPQLSPSWGLDRIDQRSNTLDSSFGWAPVSPVVILFLDSGINRFHMDLAPRVLPGVNVVAGEDPTDTADCSGHGTHIAGIAIGNEVGVARNAVAIPIRVYGCSASGPLSSILAGVSSALAVIASLPTTQACVINLSFSTPTRLPLLDTAVAALAATRCLVTAASGNDGGDASVTSPQAAGIIRVTASTSSNALASFSDAGQSVDIVAPGAAILSTSYADNSSFAIMSGTSMSAPFVAGAAALAFGAFPTATAANIAAILLSTATGNALAFPVHAAGTPNALLFTPSCGFALLVNGACVTPSASPSAARTPTPSATPSPGSSLTPESALEPVVVQANASSSAPVRAVPHVLALLLLAASVSVLMH